MVYCCSHIYSEGRETELADFLFTYFSSESPECIGSYYTPLERYFQGEHNAIGIVNSGKQFRIDGEILETSFTNLNLGGDEVWTSN